MTRSRKAPLAAFSPRLLEVWKKASLSAIKIPIEDYKKGVVLRQRLYAARAAMKAEDHPDYLNASFVSIVIRELPVNSNYWFVIAERGDADFEDNLAAAGIGEPIGSPPSIEELLMSAEDLKKQE